MEQGTVLIISGPSGSGKGTLRAEVSKAHPDFAFSVSVTTRKPRAGERDGVDYLFITQEEFDARVAQNDFLEFERVVGNSYGTPRQPVEECLRSGGVIILEIDVKGALKVMEKKLQCVSLFIMPPSMEELERRLRGRKTESEESIQRRLATAKEEILLADRYDHVVVNDTIDRAAEEIEEILRGAGLSGGNVL